MRTHTVRISKCVYLYLPIRCSHDLCRQKRWLCPVVSWASQLWSLSLSHTHMRSYFLSLSLVNCLCLSSQPGSHTHALQEEEIGRLTLAQRVERHMGGVFCNLPGRTTHGRTPTRGGTGREDATTTLHLYHHRNPPLDCQWSLPPSDWSSFLVFIRIPAKKRRNGGECLYTGVDSAIGICEDIRISHWARLGATGMSVKLTDDYIDLKVSESHAVRFVIFRASLEHIKNKSILMGRNWRSTPLGFLIVSHLLIDRLNDTMTVLCWKWLINAIMPYATGLSCIRASGFIGWGFPHHS